MDGSPQRKKTRFSEYQQVFEYSSKGKKEADLDNDSLLLDTNEYDGNERKGENQIEEYENDSNIGCRLKIDEITSDLAAIEAYLQEESKPIDPEPIKESPIELTPEKDTKNKNPPNQRFSLSIKPELLTGRETMNLEQETKFKSAIKDLPSETSNNKKRMMNEQNKEKSLDERIENQMKNNKRITMDVKDLMNMLNDYKIDEEKKVRDDRKNRITMDVFTLAKLIETTGEDDNFDDDFKMQVTPMKIGDKSTKKSKVFSVFKENPHPEDVKLFIGSYLNDVNRRLQEKQNENKRLTEVLSELKSESVKLDLRIFDAKKRSSQRIAEKSVTEKKIKCLQQELDKRKYEEDISYIKCVESDLQLQILKLDITEESCYGHFIFDELFLKVKSKTKNSPTDIKIMISQEAKNKGSSFIIGVDDAVKILKEYHDKIKEKALHFVETVFTLRKAYQRILKLDTTLFYFSIDFELKDIQINKSFDKLSFQTIIGSTNRFLIEIDLESYLTNEQNPRSISIYNHHKSEYVNMNTTVNDEKCVIFESMKKIVEAVI